MLTVASLEDFMCLLVQVWMTLSAYSCKSGRFDVLTGVSLDDLMYLQVHVSLCAYRCKFGRLYVLTGASLVDLMCLQVQVWLT